MIDSGRICLEVARPKDSFIFDTQSLFEGDPANIQSVEKLEKKLDTIFEVIADKCNKSSSRSRPSFRSDDRRVVFFDNIPIIPE